MYLLYVVRIKNHLGDKDKVCKQWKYDENNSKGYSMHIISYIILYMYSDRDKSWPIILGKSQIKSVKTYPSHFI